MGRTAGSLRSKLLSKANSPPYQKAFPFSNLSLSTNPQSLVNTEAAYSPFDKGGRGDLLT